MISVLSFGVYFAAVFCATSAHQRSKFRFRLVDDLHRLPMHPQHFGRKVIRTILMVVHILTPVLHPGVDLSSVPQIGAVILIMVLTNSYYISSLGLYTHSSGYFN